GLKKDQYENLLLDHSPLPQKRPKRKIAEPILPKNMESRISLSVTEEIPVKTLLLEAAQKAKVNIALDPTIMGSLYYQAENEPFIDVIQAISDLVGLRYQIKGQTLRIEPDEPYM